MIGSTRQVGVFAYGATSRAAHQAVRAARDPSLLARVDAARAEALRAGVRGIPTFDFEPDAPGGGASRVVGCQRYEILADALRKAGARRREASRGAP